MRQKKKPFRSQAIYNLHNTPLACKLHTSNLSLLFDRQHNFLEPFVVRLGSTWLHLFVCDRWSMIGKIAGFSRCDRQAINNFNNASRPIFTALPRFDISFCPQKLHTDRTASSAKLVDTDHEQHNMLSCKTT